MQPETIPEGSEQALVMVVSAAVESSVLHRITNTKPRSIATFAATGAASASSTRSVGAPAGHR